MVSADGENPGDPADRAEEDANAGWEEEAVIAHHSLVPTESSVQASKDAKAAALKRALTQLASIRNVVPGYKALHARVLGSVRSLTTEDDDISAAGSDEELESPTAAPRAESHQDPNTPLKEQGEQQVAPSPAVIQLNVCVCVRVRVCAYMYPSIMRWFN